MAGQQYLVWEIMKVTIKMFHTNHMTDETIVIEKERETYLEDEVGSVILEKLNGNLFVHIYVNVDLTPDVVRYMRSVWEMLQWDAYWSGFDDIFSYSENERFIKLMDKEFKPVKKIGHVTLFHKELEDYGN